MILSTLRAEIEARTEDSSISSTQIDRWINMGIKQWANRADWPSLVEQDSTTTTTADTQEYSLPTDFKKMISVRISDSTGGTEPDATEYSFIEYKDKNISSQGMWYYLNPDDATIGLVPTPPTTGLTVYLKYYEVPADLTIVTEEPPMPETYHELVIFFALFENMVDQMKLDLQVRSTGDLKRIKDVRETMTNNQPQQANAINLGK